MSAEAIQSRRDWLLSERPASRMQARLGRAYVAWRRFSANRLAFVGLRHYHRLAGHCRPCRRAGHPISPTFGDLKNSRLAARQAPNTGSAPTISAVISCRASSTARAGHSDVVILVAIIAAPIGLLVGTVAGYAGGWTDAILMRITDIFLAFPQADPGAGLCRRSRSRASRTPCIAIAITSWPPYARIARAETLTVRNSDYIKAVQLMGASPFRIVLRHIMPLCISSLIVRVTLDMAGIILTAAGLGFLGLGAQPPLPEWGTMIASGRPRSCSTNGGWPASPGFAILIVSLGFNLLGDGLRDALDPRSGDQ